MLKHMILYYIVVLFVYIIHLQKHKITSSVQNNFLGARIFFLN